MKDENRSDGPKVLILSAKKQEGDRIVGLESGADDYIVKPFSPRELVLRIRTALRYPAGPSQDEADEPLLSAGPIELDEELYEARSGRKAWPD